MRANMNASVAQQIIRAGLWPVCADGCQPKLLPNGEIITFFDINAAGRKSVVGKLSADGVYSGAKRNVATLVELAGTLGLDLGLTVREPTPPLAKKVREPAPRQVENTAKSARTTKLKREQAPKPALSLRDLMASRKQEAIP